MTHHLDAVAGFATATASTATLWVAQAAPVSVEPWLQFGGTAGLIGGLAAACVALWKDRQILAQSLRDADAARLQDAKDSLEQYRLHQISAEQSRRDIITELRNQTDVIREK